MDGREALNLPGRSANGSTDVLTSQPFVSRAPGRPFSRQTHVIAAPTGSGKTLAAFLAAIDDLVRQGQEGPCPTPRQIVYVSASQGAQQRHSAQPRAAAEWHSRSLEEAGFFRGRHTHHGAHRRYPAVGAHRDAQAPTPHSGNHPGVTLHPAHQRRRARHPAACPSDYTSTRSRYRGQQARRALVFESGKTPRLWREDVWCGSVFPPPRSLSTWWPGS